MKFELIPYVKIGSFEFGMSEDSFQNIAGCPERKEVNRRGESDYRYLDYSARFSKSGLVEVGCQPSIDITVKGISVYGDNDAFQKLIQLDGKPYELLGFIVLLELGMALTGFHDGDENQKAVTVFSKGHWEHLASQFSLFLTGGRKSE